VGIIPFAWVASGGAPSGLTNVGPNALKALWGSTGFLSAEIFTGNSADRAHKNQTDGVMIYATGRDSGSGTRLNAFAESGIGINSAVNQVTVATAETGVTISNNTATHLTYDDRLNNVVGAVDPGNGGESSGGTLADNLRYTLTSVADDANSFVARPIAFITYLGESDSYRAVAGSGSKVTGTNSVNARYLTYNGVSAFQGSFFNDFVDTTSGSPTITISSGATGTFTNVVQGQAIRGPGIPADAVVVSVSGTSITMSKNATATLSGTGSSNAKSTVANLIATPIREGNYTFWSYEHIMWNSSVVGTSGDKFTVATGIRDQIKSGGYQSGSVNAANIGDYFLSGLANDSAMQAKRSIDGGGVVTTY
jgi:hypothetical protein